MLSSTRATARSLTARASSSFAQALPAESSRQGLLRAIAQQRQQQRQRQRQLHTEQKRYSAEVDDVFNLPNGDRPGVKDYNALLRRTSRMDGLDGLRDTLKLFRTSGIKPDETTLQIVLDCVKTTTTSDPTELATILNALLRQLPDLQPSPDHLDFLLGQAVRARSRDSHVNRNRNGHGSGPTPTTNPTPVKDTLASPAEVDSANAQAGLRPNDPFKKAIQGIIQSLQARGARSASKSLANRLRFEAQAHSGSSPNGPLISAQTVWNDMISRGIKPDKRHLLALMKGYADSGHMQECEDVILLAKDMGIEVTRGMWMVIMTGYGRRGELDLKRAEKAFQAIKSSEQGLDPAAVCAMIGIYLRARQRYLANHLALQLVGNLVVDPQVRVNSNSISSKSDSDSPTPTFSSLSSSSSSSSSSFPSASISSSAWSIPPFPASMLNERVIAIATDALRLDHPQCALQVIQTAYPPISSQSPSPSSSPPPAPLPARVKQVVRSIKSRSRSRIKWNVADSVDLKLLVQADQILSGRTGMGTGTGSSAMTDTGTAPGPGAQTRRIGPGGVKKRLLRLFERKRHGHRGSGGRKVISAKEEKRVRHEMISNPK